MKTYVIVRLQVDGEHNFPAAAELFPEVAFLASPHRHIFHIEAKVEVFHDNRDKEFIMLKRDMLDYLKKVYYNDSKRTHVFGPMSCEMICKDIMTQFNCKSVQVWEDLENGAEVVRED
jgi:hypothetical protein